MQNEDWSSVRAVAEQQAFLCLHYSVLEFLPNTPPDLHLTTEHCHLPTLPLQDLGPFSWMGHSCKFWQFNQRFLPPVLITGIFPFFLGARLSPQPRSRCDLFLDGMGEEGQRGAKPSVFAEGKSWDGRLGIKQCICSPDQWCLLWLPSHSSPRGEHKPCSALPREHL